MGKLGRSAINDVKRSAPQRQRVVYHNGKRRKEKRPTGVVEVFVHPSGHTTTIQLRGIGLPKSPEFVDKERGDHHRNGFVEHGRCPLRNGTAVKTPALEDEFRELLASMPREFHIPCSRDTGSAKNGRRAGKATIEIVEPCVHIKALIKSRLDRKAAEDAEKRENRSESAAELRQQELALQREQLAEQRKTNAFNAQLMQHLAGGGIAPQPTPPAASSAPAPQPEISVDLKDLDLAGLVSASEIDELLSDDPDAVDAGESVDAGDASDDDSQPDASVSFDDAPPPPAPKKARRRS